MKTVYCATCGKAMLANDDTLRDGSACKVGSAGPECMFATLWFCKVGTCLADGLNDHAVKAKEHKAMREAVNP